MRLPSNAAVTFLRWTGGSENGSGVSSIMAGVAAFDQAGLASTTKSLLSIKRLRYIRQRIPGMR